MCNGCKQKHQLSLWRIRVDDDVAVEVQMNIVKAVTVCSINRGTDHEVCIS